MADGPSDQMENDQEDARNQILISRPVYTQEEFDHGYNHTPRHSKTIKERAKGVSSKCSCSWNCIRNNLSKWFPFIKIMKGYDLKRDLLSDVMSGITVGVMHIPQGMAYGLLANLPPVYGLYVSFFPVILYFFLGTSRHISIGTFAVVSLMVGSVVDKGSCDDLFPTPTDFPTNASAFDPQTSQYPPNTTQTPSVDVLSSEALACKVGIATAVTFIAGLYQFLMGLFHMGFVTIYLSEPLTRAFTTAAAVHVFTSQIKYIFGISVARFTGPLKIIYSFIDFFKNITTTNIASLIMAIISMAIIYLTKRFINPRVKAKIRIPVPIELIMVVIGTLISYFGNFQDLFDMQVVGEIPTGIPPPSLPPPYRFPMVMADAIGICIVAFAISVSMGQLFAKSHNYDLDSNQELVAYGLGNILSSCFNCYVSAASLSRSLIQDNVGGKTQVAGLVSCCLLIIVLFFIGPLFRQCPNNVLAAIIIVNLKGMFLQLLDLKKLWNISKYDFLIWIVTFLAATILDIDLGLLVGICFSLFTVVFRNQRPYTCVLGRVSDTDLYKDLRVYGNISEVPSIKIFRFESSMFYANCEHFMKKIFDKTENPRKLKQQQLKAETKYNKTLRRRTQEKEIDVKLNDSNTVTDFQLPISDVMCIVIDCSTMAYVDYVAISTLQQVVSEYKEVGIDVVFAGCKAGVREMMQSAGFFKKVEKHTLFLSVHDAVVSAQKTIADKVAKINGDATRSEETNDNDLV